MSVLSVSLHVLPHGRDLQLPSYATPGSAGCDLRAAIESEKVLQPGEIASVPTGLRIALPADFEAQVRPRSGLAFRHGVTLLNSPGTIDADYRGEIGVLLINLGPEPYVIHRGDRVAQLIVAPVVRCRWHVSEALEDTDRGAGGFGSTGR